MPPPEPVIIALKLLIVRARLHRTVVPVTVLVQRAGPAVDVDDLRTLDPPLDLALEAVLLVVARRELGQLPVQTELTQVGGVELGQRAERAVHHHVGALEGGLLGAAAQLDVHRKTIRVALGAEAIRRPERVVGPLEEKIGAALAPQVLVAFVGEQRHAHVLVVALVVVVGRAGLGVLGGLHRGVLQKRYRSSSFLIRATVFSASGRD